MKISEIHKAFKVMMDKNAEAVAFGGCPAFLPAEIDLFLNQAYIEVVSNKYTGTNVISVPFEGSVKRIADLERLVKTDYSVPVTFDSSSNVLTMDNFLNSSAYNQRMFYVTAVVRFGNNSTTCSLTDHNSARRFLKTYNNDPWVETPISTLENNKLKVYIDVHKMAAPYSIDITYVKFPQKIDSNTPTVEIDEVPDRVMYEVINRAALIALEDIESKRVETKIQTNNLQE